MAILRLEKGTTSTELGEISLELAPLGVQLNRWSLGENLQMHRLLAQESLNEAEKKQVLQTLDHYFEELQHNAGYQSRDLIVLHPGVADLSTLLAKFSSSHIHAEDEVRYIIDGEGVFGFVCSDGSQVELTVQAEDYIHVPVGTEHWFYLTSSQRIKAVRYFTTTEGWVPQYTNTKIRLSHTLEKRGNV